MQALAAEGATVAVHGREKEHAGRVAGEITTAGGKAETGAGITVNAVSARTIFTLKLEAVFRLVTT